MQSIKKENEIAEDAQRSRRQTQALWQSQTRHIVLVFGAMGSPYTRKVLSALRYQRVPAAFITIWSNSHAKDGFPIPPGPPLLPNVVFIQDWKPMADSTFILKEAEKRNLHENGRSLVPNRPALALLSQLLEDFADEWMTKPMYHYRWHYARDAAKAGILVPTVANPHLLAVPDEDLNATAKMLSERQINRLPVVGSSAKTKDIIEDSYVEFLRAFNMHISAGYGFLLGDRPSAADFAVFGQLSQLVGIDPTSMAICESVAPRVCAWVQIMEDMSGTSVKEGGWRIGNTLPPTLFRLLKNVVGRYYIPYMLANEEAMKAKADVARFFDRDGREWTSEPFKYQQKCVGWLRESYAALSPHDRHEFDVLIRGTDCEPLFATSAKL